MDWMNDYFPQFCELFVCRIPNFGDEYCQTASLGILCDADADV